MSYAQQAPTLEKVKSSGVITIGYRESSIPFAYLDSESKPTGFGWEICNRIVENVKKSTGRTDLKVNSQPVTGNNRIPLLLNGTIDLECGSTTNNTTRQSQVAFSINYFYTGTRLLVKTSSQIKTYEDLKGRKVASTAGTTNFQVMRKLYAARGITFELLAGKDHADSALMLDTGRVDAFAMDDILLFGVRANSANPTEYEVVAESLQVEPYAPMLRKDDPTFKKLVDDTLAGLIKSGEFETLYKKWFQSPIPPKGINLNAPMSPELKENLKALSDKPSV